MLLKDLELQRTQLETTLKTSRDTYGSASPAIADLLNRKTALDQQIDIIKHGTLASYQGRLEFYIKRVFIEMGRTVAFFANPAAMVRSLTGTKMRGLQKGFFERFSRDEANGISQLEQFGQLIEQKIRRLEGEGFRAESMPWIKEFRFRYEDWRLRRRELSASRALETVVEKLDQIDGAPHAKYAPRGLVDAVDALQQAHLLFLKDINSVRWLAENSEPRKLLGVREAVTGVVEVIRGHIENSAREALGRRPQKIYEPAVNDFTKLFFGRTYLRLTRQAEALKHYRELMESGIRSGNLPYNLEAIRGLELAKTAEAIYKQRIDAFRSEFDLYFKSDWSSGLIPDRKTAPAP